MKEKGIENKTENWADYMHQMIEYVEKNDPNQLEDLLRQDHPLLPGEAEAFLWLQENLERKLRVKLDKSGEHVVPVEHEDEK